MRTEVLLIQEVSVVYTSLSLNTDFLNMAFQARKDTGAFEKWAPGDEVGETRQKKHEVKEKNIT